MSTKRWIPWVMWLVAMALLSSAPATAGDIKEKEPSPKSKGELCTWKSKDGLQYNYRVPKKYDAEKGATLTLILHGSNLSRGWGFANHSYKTFRPDDLVVSPDGTTSNGSGGFNFLGKKQDAKRLVALIDELKEIFNLKKTYLYGHSQGSFFAFYFAGENPEYVDGIVGHASGVWADTQRGPKGHHQAVVLMHGTADPVVPYGQSVGGFKSLVDSKYPMVRLRSLEGWNHWPAEHNGDIPHTSQQVAWCEGMTTDDPERLEACLGFLRENKSKTYHDYAALRSMADRIADLEDAPEALRRQAAKAVEAVDELALAHVADITIPDKASFDGGAWVGHLPVFLRAFHGVPAGEELRKTWSKVLDKQKKDAIKHLRKFWPAFRKGDKKKAFPEGLAALEKGFLWRECWAREFRKYMADIRKEGKAAGLGKRDMKRYDGFIKDFDKALKDGYRAFEKVNSKAKL